MPDLRLDHRDATELAELLTFLADSLSGTQKQTLAGTLAIVVGHTGYDMDELRWDLHREADVSHESRMGRGRRRARRGQRRADRVALEAPGRAMGVEARAVDR